MIVETRRKPHLARVHGEEIDFYLKPINTHVQFDGIYWHGLDRPLDKLNPMGSHRDKCILNTVKRDRKQDDWFKENNMRLVRITDKELTNYQKSKQPDRLHKLFHRFEKGMC